MLRRSNVSGPIVAQGYGANEFGLVTWLSPEAHLRSELLTTVGRPVPGAEVSIRDSSGKQVDTGVTGEIWARGPSFMTGYYKQPELTAKVLRDGWFRSGDLGFLDAEGYLSIVGRSTDVIIIAGGHVYRLFAAKLGAGEGIRATRRAGMSG